MPALLHTCLWCLYLTQSAPVQVADLLLSVCCGVNTFASAPGTGARSHVWGGTWQQFHGDYTERNAKQISPCSTLAFTSLCKHSGIKYKLMFSGCIFLRDSYLLYHCQKEVCSFGGWKPRNVISFLLPLPLPHLGSQNGRE